MSQSISRLALFSALLGLDFVMRSKSKSSVLGGVMVIFSSTWLSLVTYPAGSISSLVVLFAALLSYAVVGFVYKQPKNEIWVSSLLVLGGLVMPYPCSSIDGASFRAIFRCIPESMSPVGQHQPRSHLIGSEFLRSGRFGLHGASQEL